VFDKRPQQVSSMPRGRASSSRSFGTHAIVAKSLIDSRKLILETSFTIKDEFSKNEGTKWAVQEMKHRGLKRLFKPIASTAYKCLVWSFYEHQRYDYSRPDVLVSSIDDRDVEVTIADVAAALKCNHEPPDSNIPWIDCPSMLTIKDIVSYIHEGQYANSHCNAASKAKIPPKLWFVDIVLYRNVCPLGHKTQRRGMFLSALYSFHRGFWCSIPKIIWRQIYKFWEGVHHRVVEHMKNWVCLSLFSSLTCFRRRGLKAM
jgi:hypothetical protein